jgi:hypothetical protein
LQGEFANSRDYLLFGASVEYPDSVMPNRRLPRNGKSQELRFKIDTERESDGRWIAEVVDIPGVLAYGRTEKQAKASAYALALRVIEA